jgi:hypothetical protein
MPPLHRPRRRAAGGLLAAAALLLPPPVPACPLDILLALPPEKLVQIVIVRVAAAHHRPGADHAR